MWTKISVLAENDTNLNDATFQINIIKHYVPVVTLSVNDTVKFLENLKQVCKRTISGNKYRSAATIQPKITIWIIFDNKLFFDQHIKKKTFEKLVKMSRNNDYTTRHLLDYMYHQNCYRLIGIDLSRQTNTSLLQQINFKVKLEEDDGAIIFFVTEKQQKTILNSL